MESVICFAVNNTVHKLIFDPTNTCYILVSNDRPMLLLCFVQSGYCGNGVIDSGEQCDCGPYVSRSDTLNFITGVQDRSNKLITVELDTAHGMSQDYRSALVREQCSASVAADLMEAAFAIQIKCCAAWPNGINTRLHIRNDCEVDDSSYGEAR